MLVGIYCHGGAGVSVNVRISNNYCADNGTAGILAYGLSRSSILGNNCYSNDAEGIKISNDVDDCVITGNVCNGNSTYGIWLSSATADNNVVTGNRATGNTTSNFTDAGTNTFFETATDSDPLNDFT